MGLVRFVVAVVVAFFGQIMLLAALGLLAWPAVWVFNRLPAAAKVAVVGAGFVGLCIGIGVRDRRRANAKKADPGGSAGSSF